MQLEIKQLAHNHWMVAYRYPEDRVIYISHFMYWPVRVTDRKKLAQLLDLHVEKVSLHRSTVHFYKDTSVNLEETARLWLEERTHEQPNSN